MYRTELPLPDFLVIGAQKSGTTTLYEDLSQHPDIGLAEKESDGLIGDPSRRTLMRTYARHFQHLTTYSRVGEVATMYSMLPDHAEVVDRAAEVRKDMKIIYIVRNPIERTISHHHHLYSLDLLPHNIDVAIRDYSALVDYSRYATQIEPWIEQFGIDHVLVLTLEEYAADRQSGFDAITSFLQIDQTQLVDHTIHNSSTSKVVASGRWGSLSRGRMYRYLLRPVLGRRLRQRAGAYLLPKAPDRPESPSLDTLLRLKAELEPETQRLGNMLQRTLPWDLSDTVRKYADTVGPECED